MLGYCSLLLCSFLIGFFAIGCLIGFISALPSQAKKFIDISM